LNKFIRSSKKGIERASLSEILGSIAAPTDHAKIDAYTIAVILKGVQQAGPDSFYKAPPLSGEVSNEEFIDTIIDFIRKGSLGIVDRRGQVVRGQEYRSDFMAYVDETNKLLIATEFPVDSLEKGALLIHELFHFYQDIKRLNQSLLQSERDAYLIGGQYFLYTSGLTSKPYDPKLLEEQFEKHFADRHLDQAFFIAIRAAYALWGNDDGAAKKWSEKLDDSLVQDYYLRRYVFGISPDASTKAQAEAAALHSNGTREAWFRSMEGMISSRFRMLENNLNSERPDPNKSDLVDQLVVNVISLYMYREMVRLYLKELDAPEDFVRNPEGMFSEQDPAIQELYALLTPLRPTAHIFRQFDGVK